MRILLVEDQGELRGAIARYLRAEGHVVEELAEARQLGDYLVDERIDVLVLDRMLPDGDAIDTLGRLRRQGDRTPTLFLSSRDTVQDRVDGLEAGADDYLVKPFAMEELTARIRSLGRRRQSPRPSVLEIGPLTIDLGRREARRHGVLIPLRPKELSLLELLTANCGRAVTKEQVLDWCWDVQHQPSSNVEEVLVASLRRKLGPPPLIHTVRGVGYLFEP